MKTVIEKALLIAGRGDGPWCPVVGLEEIHVEGLDGDDSIRLEAYDRTLLTITENGVHSVKLAEGKVRVVRISGESRVTVRAFAES